MDTQRYPKVELHLHLDCSLSYQVVHTIDPTITEEQYRTEFIAPARCTDLADFLTRAPKGFGLMQTKENLRLVVLDLFEQLKQDNVIYAEIRFAPYLHLQQGLTPDEVVETTNAAVGEAIAATGIDARLILCTLRHFTKEQSLHTAQLVKQFQGTYVVALDIAGDEAGYPLVQHIPAFQYAIEHGLHRTAHAGEACGADSVWETLQYLQPTRIGHGVRSSEDPALLEVLKQKNIHLEVCPSSNLQTNMYPSYAQHPIQLLHAYGVSLGINTDTRTITDITLNQEYKKLHDTFAWQQEQFFQCNLAALHAAFLSTNENKNIEQKLRKQYFSL